MGWLRAVAAVVGCGLLTAGIAGCTGDDPGTGPSPTPSASASTSVSPTPEPTAAPVAPVLPAAAKEATEAGARAFIAYYWKVVDYAQVTGNVDLLATLSSRTCDVCVGFVEDLRDHYAAGGHIVGGENLARVLAAVRLSTDPARAYRLELDVSHRAQTIVSSDGTSEERTAGSDRFTAYLLWTDSRWRVDVMVLK